MDTERAPHYSPFLESIGATEITMQIILALLRRGLFAHILPALKEFGIICCMPIMFLTGCLPLQTQPEETTQQVPASPFGDARKPAPTRVQYAPASQDASLRVLLVKDQLIAKNERIGLKPYAIAIGSPDPEIFHVGNAIYITEGMVRQCATDSQLAAVVAFELGRMVSEREATVADEIRQPERPLPIRVPIAGSNQADEADPLYRVELARHEKEHPKHAPKLQRPNPQAVARVILENAGYQRTDLDAVFPILNNAERYTVLETQFKGPGKQSDWKSR